MLSTPPKKTNASPESKASKQDSSKALEVEDNDTPAPNHPDSSFGNFFTPATSRNALKSKGNNSILESPLSDIKDDNEDDDEDNFLTADELSDDFEKENYKEETKIIESKLQDDSDSDSDSDDAPVEESSNKDILKAKKKEEEQFKLKQQKEEKEKRRQLDIKLKQQKQEKEARKQIKKSKLVDDVKIDKDNEIEDDDVEMEKLPENIFQSISNPKVHRRLDDDELSGINNNLKSQQKLLKSNKKKILKKSLLISKRDLLKKKSIIKKGPVKVQVLSKRSKTLAPSKELTNFAQKREDWFRRKSLNR